MTNTATPSGFTPRSLQTWHRYYIPKSDTTAYGVGDLVRTPGGADANGIPIVALHTGSATVAVRGAIVAVDPGLPATGGYVNGTRLRVPATKTQDYYVWVCDDPEMEFLAVDDGLTPSALVGANIGSLVGITVGTTPNANGGSSTSLTSASFGGTTGLCKVVGLAGGSTLGAYATWAVRFPLHELGNASTVGGSGTSTIAGATDYATASLPVDAAAAANALSAAQTAQAAIPTQAQQVDAVPASTGNYNAATNTPTRTAGVAPADGNACLTVTVAGVFAATSGNIQLYVGDEIWWNGSDYSITRAVPVTASLLKGDNAGGVVAATAGVDYALPITFNSGVPFVMPSSGTVGSNGAVTFTTAFGASDLYKGFFYYPANSITGSNAAGWYWTEMSSTTTGTIYNNTYTSGVPTRPTKVAFSGSTGAAYTQLTTAVTAQSLTLAANLMGPNGHVRWGYILRNNNSAGVKTLKSLFGGAAFGLSVGPTTSTSTAGAGRTWNAGATGEQFNLVTDSTTGVANTLIASTVDTTQAQPVGYQMQLASATDWMALVDCTIETRYGA